MPITVYGAFRSDTTMTDDMATFATAGSVFQIFTYSQITISDGADPNVIDGDDVVNETPNDPTQTYLGNAIDWDYTIEVNDGTTNYTIGIMDYDLNGDGDFDYPTGEQGFFIAFVGGIPPLNTDLTFGAIADNGPSIPVDTTVPCFVAGTLILTPSGPRRVEDLAVGDLVSTIDHGAQPIRWIGVKPLDDIDLASKPDLRPIRISKGALGPGLPKRDLLVSPQHRMLLRSQIAVQMFATEEILVPAKKLVGLPGIDWDTKIKGVDYLHFLCDRHEIVFAEGALTESLFLGEEALKSIGKGAREEIFGLFPELKSLSHTTEAARPIPEKGREMRDFVRRFTASQNPVYQIC